MTDNNLCDPKSPYAQQTAASLPDVVKVNYQTSHFPHSEIEEAMACLVIPNRERERTLPQDYTAADYVGEMRQAFRTFRDVIDGALDGLAQQIDCAHQVLQEACNNERQGL